MTGGRASRGTFPGRAWERENTPYTLHPTPSAWCVTAGIKVNCLCQSYLPA
ncbi:hypothetical protein H6G72_13075 [Planktothricoides sp. FACHB-1370]|uniref:Uncharacterized protein n=1 Tax=Planktothricoides raciborskii FACHB-1370 TaxID=2949576 RepID=A0ABR8EF19_9CYAN|nr:hypothetical protein [Planktothricoides raciborskii FACHB-1370]MBD2582840.1 hypothetical protein [Planktothricoides raciborskii FACHB-1261]